MVPRAVIAIPVRNEIAHLPRLLDALGRQVSAPTFALVLFFDGCVDGGPALAAAIADALPFPLLSSIGDGLGPPNAGLARGRACAAALAHAPDASLLTTDADSMPSPDWVASSLAGLAAAEIVAGRIEPAPCPRSGAQQRLAAYLDRLHRHRRAIDPVPWEDERTHHWTSGASMAFRPRTYRALGGFSPLPCGEDGELGDRAWRAGLRLRRDARVRVTTSARRQGRVADGFAGMLTALDRDASPVVAHPDDEAWRYHRHAQARACWAAGATDAFAQAVRTTRAALDRIAADAPNAEAFTARAVGTPPGGMRLITLAHAETALDGLEAGALAGAA